MFQNKEPSELTVSNLKQLGPTFSNKAMNGTIGITSSF